MSSRLFQFSGDRLGAIEWCNPHAGDTVVADSWLVEEGQAVAMDRHADRFSRSVVDHCGLTSSMVDSFIRAVRETIPPEGSWFPRIEATATRGGTTLRYRERPAPPRETDVVLAVGDHDPRTTPHRKGPDLDALMALRRSVSDRGATEALIVSPSGHIIEGAYSTLVWWPAGSDHLSIVSADLPRIPSVTESVVLDIANELGIGVSAEMATVADLAGAEVWVLSALHGIRRATRIIDGPHVDSEPGRSDQWQAYWWDRRLPVVGNDALRQ